MDILKFLKDKHYVEPHPQQEWISTRETAGNKDGLFLEKPIKNQLTLFYIVASELAGFLQGYQHRVTAIHKAELKKVWEFLDTLSRDKPHILTSIDLDANAERQTLKDYAKELNELFCTLELEW